MTNTEPHPGHENHLCALVENGITEQTKDLIRNPNYICSCCGRAAKNKENLCSPEPL